MITIRAIQNMVPHLLGIAHSFNLDLNLQEERVLRYSYDCAGYDHCEQKMRIEIGSRFSKLVRAFFHICIE